MPSDQSTLTSLWLEKKQKTDDQYYTEWVEKYGTHGAEIILKSVEENLADYEYLKRFAITV